jgi:hypothetical protein
MKKKDNNVMKEIEIKKWLRREDTENVGERKREREREKLKERERESDRERQRTKGAKATLKSSSFEVTM